MVEIKEGLPITPAVVRWARERSGYTMDDASLHFKKISAWENGEALPTYVQVEQMADRFKIPVAVFFFPGPPDAPSIEKSFRTLSAENFAEMPRTMKLLLRRGRAMQLNLAELNNGKNPSERVISRDLHLTTNTSLEKIAAKVRSYLKVSLEEQTSWKNIDTALERWREIFAANAGVFVFKDAFRTPNYFGFCLHDEEFPVIYVNNSSTKSRQIFTLFHELGHLLFHTSGIDVVDDYFINHLPESEHRIEIVCNNLAASVLVPNSVFDKMLVGLQINRTLASQLADHFCVSREVIYRKFLDRNLISKVEYEAASKDWLVQTKKKEESSGNYYNSHRAYLGQRYIDLAFTRYHQQQFGSRQLAEYLNIKPKNLPTFAEKFAGGGL